MDLTLKTETYATGDYTWLGSQHHVNKPITLKAAAFTEGTHFADGYIPSGWPLEALTGGDAGLYGPVATPGVETMDCILANDVSMKNDDGTTKGNQAGAGMIHGVVVLSRLPLGSVTQAHLPAGITGK